MHLIHTGDILSLGWQKEQLIEALTCPQPCAVPDKVTAMALVTGKLTPDCSPALLCVP